MLVFISSIIFYDLAYTTQAWIWNLKLMPCKQTYVMHIQIAGCYWTGCQSKWFGVCSARHFLDSQSDDCDGLCVESKSHLSILKFGKKNAETRSFPNCVDQRFDCMKIDISWFRWGTGIGSLWMTSADNDNGLQLASENTYRTLQKGKD